MIRLRKKRRPAFIEAYRKQTRPRLPGKAPLDTLRFVALDTEATGFQIEKDRILSAACIEIRKDRINVGTSRMWIVKQSYSEPNKATAIHGLLPEEVSQGIEETDLLQVLVPMLSGAIVVGHNIHFDALLLNEALLRHHGTGFINYTLDCGHMAMSELIPFQRTGYARQRMPSIEDICGHLNLPMPDRHTAEGDAFIAAQLFVLLAARMRRRLHRDLILRDLPLRRL